MEPRYVGFVRVDSLPAPNQGMLDTVLRDIFDTAQTGPVLASTSPEVLADRVRSAVRESDLMEEYLGGMDAEYLDTVGSVTLSDFDRVESYVVDDGSRNFIDHVAIGFLADKVVRDTQDARSVSSHDPFATYRHQFDLLWRGAFDFCGDSQDPLDSYAHHSGKVDSCMCIGLPEQWEAWDSLGTYESLAAFFDANAETLEALGVNCRAVSAEGCSSLLATGDIITTDCRTTPWQGTVILDVAPSAALETPGWPDTSSNASSTTHETLYGLVPFYRAYRWGQARIQDLDTMEAENRDNLRLVRDTDELQSMIDSLTEINAQRELSLRIRDEQSEIERFARRLHDDNLGGAIYGDSIDERRPEEFDSESETSLINAYRAVLEDVISEFDERFETVADNQSSTTDIVRSRIQASASKANVDLQDQIAASVTASSDLQGRVYLLTLVLALLTVVLVADALWTPVRDLLDTQPGLLIIGFALLLIGSIVVYGASKRRGS